MNYVVSLILVAVRRNDRRKILIIEDEQTQLLYLKYNLTKEEYNVVTATDDVSH